MRKGFCSLMVENLGKKWVCVVKVKHGLNTL
jgi:hypothetical protein